MFYTVGEDIISEVIPLKKGKTVKIYISKKRDKYAQSCKCFGTHYLEQIIDHNGKILQETIKKNPHHIKLGILGSPEYD